PRLDITGPLTSDNSLLYRLNTLYSRAESFRDFDQEIERFSVAPTLTWNISENTNLTVSLEYLDQENPLEAGIVAAGDGVVDVPRDRITNEPNDIAEFKFLQVGYDFEHRFSDNWKLRNGFRFFREEEEVSGILNAGFDESSGNVFRGFLTGIENRNTYEIQTNIVGKFATGSIEHTLLFGVDYTRAEIPDRTLFANFTAIPPLNIFDPVYGAPQPDSSSLFPLFNEDNTTTDKVGIYIQDQVDILDNFILLLGGRFDFFDQDKPDNLNDTVANQYEEAFSPRVGLVYQPVEEVSLYASYSRSFLPNIGTTFSSDFLEPERGEQFEVGTRAEVLDGRLVANLAFFNLTKQNVAVPDPDFPPALGISIPSGERRSRGIELDISGEILPGWNLIANYAYLDTEITEDNRPNIEGNQLFGAPEHSANLWTIYEIQSGDLQGLSFGIGFNFVGERFGDDDNSFELDSYFLTNAAIAYKQDNLRFGLNLKNLFDVDYIETTANSRLSLIPGEGFTIIGSVSIEF
ncbi:MAG: TonB-dependent siderophore receptor, partial [Moorea sp. SIO2I5]|nr:TonB-dependent siderophore receptor [Moorena sp. SIO2I5]